MTTPVLQITGLHKNFGALHVARDIHFRLDPGARHALIGPNGAGKTTLVNLISGALKPTAGEIMLQSRNITHLSQAARCHLGLTRTFQINQLFTGLTVLDNVCLSIAERTGIAASMLRPLGRRHDVIDEAMHLLESFKLQDDALTVVSELPYGRQRLVEIVIALGQKPTVLLLDEPAAGIPSAESQIILDVIEELSDEISVLIIEHDMEIVFRFANQITVLVYGTILAQGTPEEIADDKDVRSAYLGESR
ncbi:MAG: ABC transporter ATP-binding protein [Gammaproteobacteria bacterium]|nr:ABC transporter ATP-binding protein [Gammaproteobacteria bacterium]